jgi:squalene-hopene/tetraprenyl-beta-curcumene cyclase
MARCQNFSATPFDPLDDGGFFFSPADPVRNKAGIAGRDAAGRERYRSYGSATYAGIMSYSWANLKKTDPRVQSVMKWVRDNYTVDENPGLGQKTLDYYYMVFAKALQAIGDPVIVNG